MANGLLFLRVVPIVCLSNIWRGLREKEAPLVLLPRPLSQPPGQLAPGIPAGEGEDPNPSGAAPPEPCGYWAEGKLFRLRLLGCLWLRAHFSDLIPTAPQRAQIQRGAAFEGVEARFRPNLGVSFGEFQWIPPLSA